MYTGKRYNDDEKKDFYGKSSYRSKRYNQDYEPEQFSSYEL